MNTYYSAYPILYSLLRKLDGVKLDYDLVPTYRKDVADLRKAVPPGLDDKLDSLESLLTEPSMNGNNEEGRQVCLDIWQSIRSYHESLNGNHAKPFLK